MFIKLIELSRTMLKCNCRNRGFPLDTANRKNNFLSKLFLSQSTGYPAGIVGKIYLHCSHNKIQKALPLLRRSSLIFFFTNKFKNLQFILKQNTVIISKNCLAQFEFVIAQRVRRAQQMFSLYSKLWDEKALRILISRLKRQFCRNGKVFMLGGSGAAFFNWDEERIKDSELNTHFKELEVCKLLRDQSENQCAYDHEKCQNNPTEECNKTSCWTPFIKKDGLIVWKKEAPERKGSGLYCYKMYGKYGDVTANDFLEAFLDTASRKSWDDHVVDLRIIDSEPETNSDVIYWETKWPKMFSNRDYIFNRRYQIFHKEKIMVVCNRGTSHPLFPIHSSKTRVSEYWSYMVIKPFSDFNEPGIEFSLTYFDNPGTSLPSAISLWVSSTGMPEYLRKLHLAALHVASKRSDPGAISPPTAHKSIDEKPMVEKVEDEISDDELICEEEIVENDKCEEIFSFFPWLQFTSSVDDSVLLQLLIT